MRWLQLSLVMVGMLLLGSVVAGQEDALEFESFENQLFGVQGVAPSDWTVAGPGVWQRGASQGDITSVIVQSAPLAPDVLLGTLQSQLGLAEIPESTDEVVTDFGTWAVYEVVLDSAGVQVTISITSVDEVTYLVLLQSTIDEHESLVETVLEPVRASVMALSAEEAEATDDEEQSDDSDASYTEENVTFMSGDLMLAGTLTVPMGEGEFPVVVLVSGSGAQDRDESLAPFAEIRPFFDIADYLSSNGIAVLRYDDRGFGESEGDFAVADLDDFRQDASAAVDFVAERGAFSMIGIVGHSEGGVYAPQIALENDAVDFVIGLAAPTVPMSEILIEQNRLIFTDMGFTRSEVSAIVDAFEAIEIAIDGNDVDALRDGVRDLVTAQTGSEPSDAIVDTAMSQFTSPIIQSYYSYEPTQFWLDLDVPTLAIFGELDIQVSAEQSIEAIEGQNELIEIVTIESMNHIFQIAETGATDEYPNLEQEVNSELLELLVEWINGLE